MANTTNANANIFTDAIDNINRVINNRKGFDKYINALKNAETKFRGRADSWKVFNGLWQSGADKINNEIKNLTSMKNIKNTFDDGWNIMNSILK